jgi:hypothetical protein
MGTAVSARPHRRWSNSASPCRNRWRLPSG